MPITTPTHSSFSTQRDHRWTLSRKQRFGTFRVSLFDPDGLNTVRSTLDFLVKSGKAPNAFDVTTWLSRERRGTPVTCSGSGSLGCRQNRASHCQASTKPALRYCASRECSGRISHRVGTRISDGPNRRKGLPVSLVRVVGVCRTRDDWCSVGEPFGLTCAGSHRVYHRRCPRTLARYCVRIVRSRRQACGPHAPDAPHDPVSCDHTAVDLWFGIDERPKIIIIAAAALFPLYINTHSGVRNVDRKVIEAGTCVRTTGSRTDSSGDSAGNDSFGARRIEGLVVGVTSRTHRRRIK